MRRTTTSDATLGVFIPGDYADTELIAIRIVNGGAFANSGKDVLFELRAAGELPRTQLNKKKMTC